MKQIENVEKLGEKYRVVINDFYSQDKFLSLTEDEVAALIELDEESVPNIKKIYNEIGVYRPWALHNFYNKISSRFRNKIKKWEEISENFDFIAARVVMSQYYSLSIFDKLAKSPKSQHKLLVIKNAPSDEILSKLSRDESLVVRREAFLKLGIKELDRMLVDSRWEIRQLGVMFAPIDYPKLNELANDISIKVIIPLVSKINKDELPYILGNRNVGKNERIRNIIQDRMSYDGDEK